MPSRDNRKSGPVTRFRESEHPAVVFARELLWVITVVGAIAFGLYLFAGTWPAMVTIESESMVPHMNVGDLVIVVEENRFGPLMTREMGEATGYIKFGDYGDVIVYRPNGREDTHPVIHRAIEWLDRDEVEAIFPGREMHEGYLTKGDNNRIPDQGSYFRGIGVIEPVKEDWIVGKALIAIPLLGYPALYLPYFAILVILILFLHELMTRRGSEKGHDQQGKRGPKMKKKI